jgi:hypothetical protein
MVSGAAIVALTARGGAVARAADGPKPPKYMVDAQVCPAPEPGRYGPDEMGPYEEALRAMLMPKRVPGMPKQHQVRVVKGKTDLWAEMMSEMQRQQGATIHLGEDQQQRALANVSRAVETKTAPLGNLTIDPLMRAVNGMLERTQYVREVLVAADGSHLYRAVFDGTTFHVWAGGRSAFLNSPEEGSLLGDFTKVARDLASLPDGDAKQRDAAEKAIRARVTALLARIAMQEPCVQPYYGDPNSRSSSKPDGRARDRVSTP